MSSGYLFAKALRRVAVTTSILSVIGAGLVTSSAAASSTAPYASYSVQCNSYPGFGGDVITAQPTRIDTLPGQGLSVIGGSNPYNNNTYGYVYYWLWVYSPAAKKWVSSFPVNTPAPYMPGVGYRWNGSAWENADSGWAPTVDLANPQYYPDLTIPGDDVGMHVSPGTWQIAVETYWAPLTTSPNPLAATIPAGGANSYAYATLRCQ